MSGETQEPSRYEQRCGHIKVTSHPNVNLLLLCAHCTHTVHTFTVHAVIWQVCVAPFEFPLFGHLISHFFAPTATS